MKRQVNTNTRECNVCMCACAHSLGHKAWTSQLWMLKVKHTQPHKLPQNIYLIAIQRTGKVFSFGCNHRQNHNKAYIRVQLCVKTCIKCLSQNVLFKLQFDDTHTHTSLCKYTNMVFVIAFFLHSFKLKLFHYNVQVMIAVKVLCTCVCVCVWVHLA